MLTMKIRGDAVEDEGAKRTLEFYDGVEIVGDNGVLFYLRLKTDGSLEISTSGSAVKHGGVLLSGNLLIKPEDSGRIVVRRDEYHD